jgi:hypothetical protein
MDVEISNWLCYTDANATCLTLWNSYRAADCGTARRRRTRRIWVGLNIRVVKAFDSRLWQRLHTHEFEDMRQFYLTFQNRHALRDQLTWTHYRMIMKVENPNARAYYLEESAKGVWSTRQLERQINSFCYERVLSSKNRDAVRDEIIKKEPGKTPLAMVCYNYVLKCFVLIDLKTGRLTHQDIGQMLIYVNYYTREMMNEGDNPPIGILLCADKRESVVKYTLPEENTQIFTSKYKLCLPTEEELRREIEAEQRLLAETVWIEESEHEQVVDRS